MKGKTKKIIEDNPLAFATIKNNKPYVIGIAHCRVVKKDKILITDNFMNLTVKNILKNDNVALIAWDKKWNGIQVLGKAKYYKKGKWLDFLRRMKENKGMPSKGAILVKIDKIIESK